MQEDQPGNILYHPAWKRGEAHRTVPPWRSLSKTEKALHLRTRILCDSVPEHLIDQMLQMLYDEEA